MSGAMETIEDAGLFIPGCGAEVNHVNLNRLRKSAWIIRIYTLHQFRCGARAVIGWADGILPAHWMLRALTGTLLTVPPGLRGRRYQVAATNLRLFQYREGDADHQARRHHALRFLCEIRQNSSVMKDPVRWRDRIRATVWHDPGRNWRPPSQGMRMVALLRTGDLFLSLACVIERCPPSTRFFVALPCFQGDPLQRMVRSLPQFGFGIETADPRDPMLSVTMVRRMVQGVTVLAFIDLPVLLSLASDLDGAALSPIERNNHELDPVGLAHLAGSDLLVVGHRMAAGEGDGLHVVRHVSHGPFSNMKTVVARHATRFIAQDPANWHHLDQAAS